MSSLHKTYLRALRRRDPRFDGVFFFGVKTTGIYCRPICPAKPQAKNIVFFASPSEAEAHGYRPCLRCRPETAPQSPAWLGKGATVQRALKLIQQGRRQGLDEEEFAAALGVSARHLRRLFQESLGKTPLQVFDEERLLTARRLLLETRKSVTEVAFASGYSSLRRFNDAFRRRFQISPRAFRQKEEL
jgi:AraC family transcriptional regulator of adaptative response / DNA-3-methyladenine glycosylase II